MADHSGGDPPQTPRRPIRANNAEILRSPTKQEQLEMTTQAPRIVPFVKEIHSLIQTRIHEMQWDALTPEQQASPDVEDIIRNMEATFEMRSFVHLVARGLDLATWDAKIYRGVLLPDDVASVGPDPLDDPDDIGAPVELREEDNDAQLGDGGQADPGASRRPRPRTRAAAPHAGRVQFSADAEDEGQASEVEEDADESSVAADNEVAVVEATPPPGDGLTAGTPIDVGTIIKHTHFINPKIILNDQISRLDIAARKQEFIDHFRAHSFHIYKSKKQQWVAVNDATIHGVANALFGLFDEGGAKQLHEVIHAIQATDSDTVAAAKAGQLAYGAPTELLRATFQAINVVLFSGESAATAHLLKLHAHWRLFVNYEELKDRARDRNTAECAILAQFRAQHPEFHKPGFGLVSLIKAYMRLQLGGMSQSQIDGLLSTVKPVQALVHHFGPGVIPLISPEAYTQLSHGTIQLMDDYCSVFLHLNPEVPQIISIVNSQFLEPLVAGNTQSIRAFANPKPVANDNLHDYFQRCFTPRVAAITEDVEMT